MQNVDCDFPKFNLKSISSYYTVFEDWIFQIFKICDNFGKKQYFFISKKELTFYSMRNNKIWVKINLESSPTLLRSLIKVHANIDIHISTL